MNKLTGCLSVHAAIQASYLGVLSMPQEMTDGALEQKIINEEYKIWKKNVPFLYDLLFSHALQWPSLSVQWFPDAKRNEDAGTTAQRLLLSTHTSGNDDECILIGRIEFPDELDESLSEEAVGDMRFRITQRIPVLEEINKVRYNPAACNVLAARSDLPDIHVYDYTRHQSNTKVPKPDMTLRGHEGGGFGLTWSTLSFGLLASAGQDNLVCVFDINQEDAIVSPASFLKGHKAAVNDCNFSFFDKNLLASVGDDCMVVLWDLNAKGPAHSVENAHTSDIFSIHFSPLNDTVFATSSSDKSVKIWDRRNLEQPLYTLLGHSKDVVTVCWSPHIESVLASSGADRRVCVWDLSQVGAQISEEAAAEGPPELMFLHGGHTNAVCDMSWNPAEPLEIASVAEDNILQIWQMPELEKN
jgi:histone-binding protein RBBP4